MPLVIPNKTRTIDPHLDADDDGRISTPDSEGYSETSCLDREVRRLRVLKSYLGVLHGDHGIKFALLPV